MRISAFILVLAVFSAATAAAQESVYRLSPATDIGLGALSAGAVITSMVVPEVYAPQVERDAIWPVDRAFISSEHEVFDIMSTVTAVGSLMLPGVSALAGGLEQNRAITYGVMYTEAFLLTTGIKDFIKARTSRWRPYTYAEAFTEAEADPEYIDSFPSGHTSYAFLGASFLTTTFRAEFPESRWRTAVPVAALGLAAGTGALRVAAGKHFPTDVLAGAAIGSAVGWAVPTLHRSTDGVQRQQESHSDRLSLSGVSVSGRGVTVRFSR